MHTTFETILTAYRNKYNVKRQAVYDGICGKTTYLYAELESWETDLLVQETLLARLGQDVGDFELILDDEAFGMWEERREICLALRGNQYDMVQEKVRAYRSEHAKKHVLHEQFCLYYEMKLAQRQGENTAQISALAAKALSFTKKIENVPEIESNLYTPMELDLLLTLVQYRYRAWSDIWKRRECLIRIIEYAEAYFSIEDREDIEGRAWVELLKLEEKYGEDNVLLEYIDKAIACFIGGNGILRLAEVRFIKGKLLHKISQTAENREDLERQCREECGMAYNIYDLMERVEERDAVKRFCEEELQWHITMQIE